MAEEGGAREGELDLESPTREWTATAEAIDGLHSWRRYLGGFSEEGEWQVLGQEDTEQQSGDCYRRASMRFGTRVAFTWEGVWSRADR